MQQEAFTLFALYDPYLSYVAYER